MPSSNLACWPEILNLVHTAPHASILDVGPGRGKAAVLLREYISGIDRLDAVEAWAPYITPTLRVLYDDVLGCDVMQLGPNALGRYELVLMVDVIEHLVKDDALLLLDTIPGSIVICTPRDYFQNPEAEEVWTEDHRSHWTLEEFQEMPRIEVAYVNQQAAVIARLGAR